MDIPFDLARIFREDQELMRQFQQAESKYRRFSDSLTHSLRSVLSHCDWRIVPNTETSGVEFVVYCTDRQSRAQLIQCLWSIATCLKRRFGTAQIKIVSRHSTFETTTEQVIGYYYVWKTYNQEIGRSTF